MEGAALHFEVQAARIGLASLARTRKIRAGFPRSWKHGPAKTTLLTGTSKMCSFWCRSSTSRIGWGFARTSSAASAASASSHSHRAIG